MINNIIIKNQNLSNLSALISSFNSTKIIIVDSLFQNNIFTKSSTFFLKTFYFLLKNVTFLQNEYKFTHEPFFVIAYPFYIFLQNDNNFFQIDQIKFIQNFMTSEIFNITNFRKIEIFNSYFESNLYMDCLEIHVSETIDFYNISFHKNNNISFLEAAIKLYDISSVSLTFLLISESFLTTGLFIKSVIETFINHSEFRANSLYSSPSQSGTAVYKNADSSYSLLQIENSLFLKNHVKLSENVGAAPCVMALMQKGKFIIKNSKFLENLSHNSGLCLNIYAYSIIIDNSSFENHSFYHNEENSPYIVGVLVVDFYNFTLLNSNFIYNSAFQGSCIFVKNLKFSHQFFYQEKTFYYKNFALFSGNAIYVSPSTADRVFLTNHTNFLYGKTKEFSGVFYFGSLGEAYYQNFIFLHCLFLQNNGSVSGSIIELYPPDPVNIFLFFEDCVFINNTQIASQFTLGALFDIWGEVLGNTIVFFTRKCIFKGFYNYLFIIY